MKTIQNQIQQFLLSMALLMLPVVGQAQFNTATIDGAITITGYTGPGGPVTIPGTLNGLPVVSIADYAFSEENFGTPAVTSVTIPDTVTNIGDWAFYWCLDLAEVYCQGDAPALGVNVFYGDTATVYYLPGAAGWGTNFGGLPTGTVPFTYTTNGGALTITGYTGPGGAVAIPDSIFGLPVTSIGDEAFADNPSVTNVTIPNSIASIGDEAFAGCSNLFFVMIPGGVATLGNNVFSNCVSLSFVTVPGSVTSLGNGVFANCSSLNGVYFQGNAPSLGVNVFQGDNATAYYLAGTTGWGTTFGGEPTALWGGPTLYAYTINNNGTVTVTGYSGPDVALTVPNLIFGLPVTSIGSDAFYDDTSLVSITLPNTVTSIGGLAFAYDDGLTSVTIPGGSIGGLAFYECANLTNATFANGVSSIGDYAFQSCGLNSVTIPGTVTYLGNYSFNGCSSLTNATIANGITSIGYGVFGGSGLISVTIPGTVTSIADSMFAGCTALGSVTIPDSVTSVGNLMFQGCTSLTNVILSSNLTSLGNSMFQGCTALTSVSIPANVSSIGTYAFTQCSGLTGITVAPQNLYYSSSNGVLFNHNQTTIIEYPGGLGGSYVIPGGVTNLASYAFQYSHGLTSVTIPGSIRSFGTDVFSYCASLTNVTIASGVTSIGVNEFAYCTSLASVAIPVGVTNIESGAFQYCASLTNVTIPAGVTAIGPSAFNSCASLASVTMPASITNIGDWAFESCPKLASVYFTGNAPAIGMYTFFSDNNAATIYYAAGTTGWNPGNYFGGITRCAQWQPPIPPAGNGFTFTTNSGALTITGYTGPGGALNIPAVTNGLPITSIGAQAFAGTTNLTTITLSTNISTIGLGAFTQCSNLVIVTIPASVTNIADDAFAGCPGLIALYFMGNPPTLDATVFTGDTNATVFYMPGTTGWNSPFAGRPALLFPFGYVTNAGAITITSCSATVHVAAIPPTINGLPVIAFTYGAFQGNDSLAGVLIPNSVTSISSAAFQNDGALTSVLIPNSVTNIESIAFQGCSGLTNVMVPASVNTIGNFAFNCRNLNAITVDPTNAFYSSINGVLLNKSQTWLIQCPAGLGGSYAIPNTVTDIWTMAFNGCTRLTNATIPASVTTIGDEVFTDCPNLTAITVATNNPAFCSVNGVWFDKSQATLIQFPEGLTGNYTIPAGVANLAYDAFGYTRLNSVTIPASLTSAEDHAFVFASLTSVYFEGNAPGPDWDPSAFEFDNATVYYLPGTAGWDTNYDSLPTAQWFLPNPVILSSGAGLGVQSIGFGFTISWATNAAVVVEACTNLANPNWLPVGTNILTTGSAYFSDPQWTNYPGRFYRVGSP